MEDELLSMNSDTGGMEVAPNCNMTCLPPKCMCHRFVFPRFVYWNPNGVAISNDKYIRTLCYNPHKDMDGTNMLSKYQKHQNAKNNISLRGCNLIMTILIYLKKDWTVLIRIRLDLWVESGVPMRVKSNPIQSHG